MAGYIKFHGPGAVTDVLKSPALKHTERIDGLINYIWESR